MAFVVQSCSKPPKGSLHGWLKRRYLCGSWPQRANQGHFLVGSVCSLAATLPELKPEAFKRALEASLGVVGDIHRKFLVDIRYCNP